MKTVLFIQTYLLLNEAHRSYGIDISNKQTNRGGAPSLFGKLTRHFDPSTHKRYGALYNFDVMFVGLKGAVGMKLEVDGTVTAYLQATDNLEAPVGTWVFLKRNDM